MTKRNDPLAEALKEGKSFTCLARCASVRQVKSSHCLNMKNWSKHELCHNLTHAACA
jgi:hypothetical protein